MSSNADPGVAQHTFEDLGDGITFGRGTSEGVAFSNTGIIDLGEATLVFDTSLTLQGGRAIFAASLEQTGRAPAIAVNSHWHLDHLLGNQVFAHLPIHATRRTIEILLETSAELGRELTREKLETDIREFEAKQRSATTDAEREEFGLALRLNRAVLAEVPEIRLTSPTSPFEGELKLPGSTSARLISFGAGHTESDAILFLPKSRVLFSGDLIVSGAHPNVGSGNPEHWLEVLDRIESLGPERIGTGHGPLGSVETIAAMRDYLSTVLALAEKSGNPEVPERFREWTGRAQFVRNVEYARSRSAKKEA
jgi:cyclase